MDIKIKIKGSFVDLMSKLIHSRDQIHILHLQSKSYSQHIALDGYYSGIVSLIDSLVETYQGKTKTLVTGYKSYSFNENSDPVTYLNLLKEDVENYRKTLDFTMDNINNQLQLVIDLIESTVYKLIFLK